MTSPEPSPVHKPTFASNCPIIGVGASAGGLEAYQQFLSSVTREQKLAYVFIQHLDPTHESLLGELLSRRTEIKVVTIAGGEKVEPATVYLTPPNAQIRIREGSLQLEPFAEPRGRRRPIDYFFTSLAEDQGRNAACVVLSGTGADGREGLRAIKAEGGLTLAQQPDQAKYAGMPQSAVDSGFVDLVLPAEKMAPLLGRYFGRGSLEEQIEAESHGDFLEQIVKTVRYRTGLDFSNYKRGTLLRRIARRMLITNSKTEESYLRLLVSTSDEVEKLHEDFLINVTEFFRDPEAFRFLDENVIPKILDGKGAGDKVRIWAPGASSGEEAYSIAILLLEHLKSKDVIPKIRIFSTDIDRKMIEVARNGVYSAKIASAMPENILNEYFVGHQNGYRICKDVRDLVHFSAHNVIQDPPYSDIDLLVCRNLLIYFDADLQSRMLKTFHYALRPHGYLFLGTAEILTNIEKYFRIIDKKAKLFERLEGKAPPRDLPMPAQFNERSLTSDQRNSAGSTRILEQSVRDKVIGNFAPPHIVISKRGEILYASERTGAYLEFKPGVPSLNIENLARQDLQRQIRILINNISDPGQSGRRFAQVGNGRDEAQRVDIYAERISDENILIIFKDKSVGLDSAPILQDDDRQVIDHDDAELIRNLESDLSTARADLRTTIEELETANEELKCSNEEMMSMNEELQSANEELTTINDELQQKIQELAVLNADLANYLSSTNIAVVFLDDEFQIREFTPASQDIFHLIESDKGRALTDIGAVVDVERVKDIAVWANENNDEISIELQETNGDRFFLILAAPYIDQDDEEFGVVISLVEITGVKNSERALEDANAKLVQQFQELDEIYASVPQGMARVRQDRTISKANDAFARMFALLLDSVTNMKLSDVVSRGGSEIEGIVNSVFESESAISNREVEFRESGDGEKTRVVFVDCYPVRKEDRVDAVGLILRDVTGQRITEAELERVMRELQHRVKNMLANVLALVRQAEHSDRPAEETINVLSSRISSLANTHRILTQSDWRAAELKDLLAAEISDVYGSNRVTFKGPDIELGPRATLSFAMSLHELATNAAKYGAFSEAEGGLDVSWGIHDVGEGPTFVFNWSEINGPKVSKPTRFGFGTTLISSSIEAALDGSVEFFYESTGLRCCLRAPLERLRDGLDQSMRDNTAP
ncbi:MAG: PAS domain-containing protein [Marinicaulis sp.]|nr:PAS domain-containing protein [Marinicaulis sp.]